MQHIEKIVQYGKTRNMLALQEYVHRVDVDEIKLIIRKRIGNSEFLTFWNYLLQALDTDDLHLHDQRYDIITTCINEIKERNISTPHTNPLFTRLCMELPKFLSKHLVSLCVQCMGFIQKGDVTETCWRELLPELLNVIVERQCVEFNSNELSGLEFKGQYVKSLCLLEWSNNIIVPLTMMFVEMPLSKEEHTEVVCKLLSYLDKMTAQEIPPFTYLILRLCQDQNSRLVFCRLQEYFDLKIYSSLTSDSSSSECIIGSTIDEDSIQAESTVLYHIYQSTLLGHESIKDYLLFLKNLTKLPDFILHPFQLTVLLTISTVAFYEDKVFELLRQCILRNFNEELRKSECCWLRNLVPNTLNMEDVLTKIILNSVNERDLVIQGLINLGFVLLGVGAVLGRDLLIVKKQWNLGKFILLNLVKEKHYVAHTILQRLCTHIVVGNNKTQYVDCFREFAIKFTYITLENKSCIVELMESLLSVSDNCADTILETVILLTKVSSTVRDHLILLLRKALYSRSIETRQIAIRGFLKLLSKLKISNLAALSQTNSSSSSSGHSVLTQISLHRSGHNSQASVFSNEALCLEVLNILRRCYMQQADIRSKLYNGLHEAVEQNPDLVLPVLNILWIQLLKYYNSNNDVLPPVDVSNTLIIRDNEVVLQEPIGLLISAITFLVIKVQELEDEDTNFNKFIDVFESMCKRLTNCELVHFGLDDGSDLLDISPESKKKVMILKQAISLYESLIGYKIWSWNKSSQKYAEQVVGLFQGFFRLQQHAKNAAKLKKVDKKKKKRSAQRSQSPEPNRSTQEQIGISQEEHNSTTIKNLKPTAIKLPHTVLDVKVLIKFLSLLNENVNWTTLQQANTLKVKHDIHQYVMQTTVFQLQQIKARKSMENRNDCYTYCNDIAKIIYPNCIVRLEEFLEFDVTTATLAVECFNIILSLVITNYNSKLKTFLCAIESGNKGSDIIVHLTQFIQKYQSLFELEDNTTDDQEFKRLLQIVVTTLSLLISQVPVNADAKFLEWMKGYAEDHELATKNIASMFANLWFSNYIRYKSTLFIFEEVINNLCQIFGSLADDQEKESSNTYKIINDITVYSFVQSITSTIKVLLENIDWMTNRLRSEYGVIAYNDGKGSERGKENLLKRERDVSCQICLIINLLEALCSVKIPMSLSELLIKNISSLYISLNSLTKYFILRSSKINPVFESARFERVVKLAGRRLAPTWNRFILYLQENQVEEVGNTQVAKRNRSSLKNKVLKETKLIPKVVYEIEQFTKLIILLSNKTKHDLAIYLGAGTTRDYRIKDIKNIIEKNKVENVTQSDIASSEVDAIEAERENTSDEISPPRKKSKT